MEKEIIFLLTHTFNSQIAGNIKKIAQEKGDRDFYVLIHGDIKVPFLSVPTCRFTVNDLQSLDFKMLENNIIPGSVHVPLFYFFKKFPDYDRYWFLEYDVEFGRNWKTLFDAYQFCDADFISSYVQRYKKNIHWPWWRLDHPEKTIPKSERIRSFNPINRFSNQSLHFLSKQLSTGWKGHHEVLLSTLLHHNNFTLLDFAEGGEFSNEAYPSFYKRNLHFPSKENRFMKLGTHRYRPAMKKPGLKNLIYHPVKMESGLSKIEETGFQLSLLKRKFGNIF